MQDKPYWISLSKVPGIGPVRFSSLIEYCGSAKDVWTAPIRTLRETGLDSRTLESLLEARRTVNPHDEWERVHRSGVSAVTWNETGYPEPLLETDAPPPVLYLHGEYLRQDRDAVAIVGTRRASAYGREVAHLLATELARHGVTVVSGLALGIDSVAHQAALDAGGRTIAVLGSGVDQVYPVRNRRMALEIVEHGAVVSEYGLGTRPEARNFPPRNRIISGLSRCIVIVEAGSRSGALITAGFAADQGRDVFAVPGSIFHASSNGCNELIRQGAIPLLSAENLLDELQLDQLREQKQMQAAVSSDPLESQVLNILEQKPGHVDDIARQATLPVAQISSLLTIMELKGSVRQIAPMCYGKA